jgi:hypothetical protein
LRRGRIKPASGVFDPQPRPAAPGHLNMNDVGLTVACGIRDCLRRDSYERLSLPGRKPDRAIDADYDLRALAFTDLSPGGCQRNVE